MGGPSRESYLAAEKARLERRAALRSRPGLVDLGEWKAARVAARALDGLAGSSEAFLRTTVTPGEDGRLELWVTLVCESAQARSCLPTAVDDIPVRVVVRNPGRCPPAR